MTCRISIRFAWRFLASGVNGLANDGVDHCVPTSALNRMADLAEHGYPAVPPGPGPWEPEVNHIPSFSLDPNIPVYNEITDHI